MCFTTVVMILGLAANQVAIAAQPAKVLPVVKTSNVQSPLLRQVFITVARKYDNLDIANATSNKGFNNKYQVGPSLEPEGGTDTSKFAKQKEAEHLDKSSSYPYVLTQPSQDAQYTTPVEEM
ncbi:hypothetical protein K493DRAFT_303359 [Basidiobolus meristosporus CBS 931.73]|uniref:Uncharacterized protein n=1 Tax=Basidiobolus meristosporus CBS 931.73 TaxID=1314790 RepID=A0A1Y1Y315_9FUNG|nr:hypothetical protein K493DRAFT_303359 [Basidiobolus meristosporus CBS 931.73]|eukprot:ORX92390.1 hypothetical protein K493DRAFT_303359 [Basidiobolus meristosporus CBS 931.73]